MKAYFSRLFDYDRYANDIILDLIIKTNSPEKPVKLMAHLLAAQQVWLNRCRGLSATGIELWPNWQSNTFADLIAQNSNNWLGYLDDLKPGDFEQVIYYKNSKGDAFENKLIDILGHAINHGTHHRAQAGQHLIAAGIENLPYTDYIFYLRQLKA